MNQPRYLRIYASLVFFLTIVLFATPGLLADPIHDAAAKGDLNKVKSLISATPDLTSAKDKMGMTPLHLAAKNDRKDVAAFLLDHGADVNAKDGNGEFTALDLALSTFHYKEMIELLLAHGANPNTQSSQGIAPLHEAAMRGQKDAIELLLTKGANVNLQDGKGNTALHWALLLGRSDAAETLINVNADVNARNALGQTPLFLARTHRNTKITDTLRQHGAHE